MSCTFECKLEADCQTFYEANTLEDLQKHFDEHHGTPEKWTCSICLKQLSKKSSRNSHYNSLAHNVAKMIYIQEQSAKVYVNPNIVDYYCALNSTGTSDLGEPLFHAPPIEFLKQEATEIVFYDVETTVPAYDMIEFGCIIVDKLRLIELFSYETLIHSEKINKRSVEANGILKDLIKNAPKFADIADKVYAMMHGRIWAGHNIATFDNKAIAREFAKIGKPAPQPTAIIDTLPLLRKLFGKRAGNMKMASLGEYFGLGIEQHRALEDCRMTIQVLKNCCTVMLLEQNFSEIFQHSEEEKKTEAVASIDSLVKIKGEVPPVSPSKPTEVKTTKATPTKAPQVPPEPKILEKIEEAMREGKNVWLTYSGGDKASKEPQHVKISQWKDEPYSVKIMYVDSKVANKEFTFITSKIVDVSDTQPIVNKSN